MLVAHLSILSGRRREGLCMLLSARLGSSVYGKLTLHGRRDINALL